MHLKTRKFVWLPSLWHLPYCGGLNWTHSISEVCIILTGLREAVTLCHPEPSKKHQSGQQGVDRSERKASARDFIGISTGKARQGRANSLGLTSVNAYDALWDAEGVFSFLVPGAGLIDLGREEYWLGVWDTDKEVCGGHEPEMCWSVYERHAPGQALCYL